MPIGIAPVPNVPGVIRLVPRAVEPMLIAKAIDLATAICRADGDPAKAVLQ